MGGVFRHRLVAHDPAPGWPQPYRELCTRIYDMDGSGLVAAEA